MLSAIYSYGTLLGSQVFQVWMQSSQFADCTHPCNAVFHSWDCSLPGPSTRSVLFLTAGHLPCVLLHANSASYNLGIDIPWSEGRCGQRSVWFDWSGGGGKSNKHSASTGNYFHN